MTPEYINALTTADPNGHQFVIYADCCSGVPNGRHEQTFAAVNRVLQHLSPSPEFICFPGDEIIGLTPDEAALRAQWDYWFNHEMTWLDRNNIPLYHTTGNHTTYSPMSERVYRDVMAHLPQNGPAEQKGLSYFVRRGNLMMVFCHTLWSGLGGEGHVETEWLNATLTEHHDATHKLVFGHHPVFPVNGFSASRQREIDHDTGQQFWDVLVKHGVLAYVCSHILAFDVQVHEGVLQILTAGAGTAHRMPEGVEYLHLMQCILDSNGLQYQVLDTDGVVREKLQWPLHISASNTWQDFSHQPLDFRTEKPSQAVVWEISGIAASDGRGESQTLLSGWYDETEMPPLWLGLTGQQQQLTIKLHGQSGRSPAYWFGPSLKSGAAFSIQIALHADMGPGGLMWRWDDKSPWSSLRSATSHGVEMMQFPINEWRVGYLQVAHDDEPFRGQNLTIREYRR